MFVRYMGPIHGGGHSGPEIKIETIIPVEGVTTSCYQGGATPGTKIGDKVELKNDGGSLPFDRRILSVSAEGCGSTRRRGNGDDGSWKMTSAAVEHPKRWWTISRVASTLLTRNASQNFRCGFSSGSGAHPRWKPARLRQQCPHAWVKLLQNLCHLSRSGLERVHYANAVVASQNEPTQNCCPSAREAGAATRNPRQETSYNGIFASYQTAVRAAQTFPAVVLCPVGSQRW